MECKLWFILSIENGVNENIAKFILWKYENYHFSDKGFEFRYDKQKITLEHIAPQTKPNTKPHGYGNYNEEFKNLIYSLGNYILLNEKYNKSIGNTTFYEKYKIYIYLKQQEEIMEMVSENGTWGKRAIRTRNKKIVKFVMSHCK